MHMRLSRLALDVLIALAGRVKHPRDRQCLMAAWNVNDRGASATDAGLKVRRTSLGFSERTAIAHENRALRSVIADLLSLHDVAELGLGKPRPQSLVSATHRILGHGLRANLYLHSGLPSAGHMEVSILVASLTHRLRRIPFDPAVMRPHVFGRREVKTYSDFDAPNLDMIFATPMHNGQELETRVAWRWSYEDDDEDEQRDRSLSTWIGLLSCREDVELLIRVVLSGEHGEAYQFAVPRSELDATLGPPVASRLPLDRASLEWGSIGPRMEYSIDFTNVPPEYVCGVGWEPS